VSRIFGGSDEKLNRTEIYKKFQHTTEFVMNLNLLWI